MKKFNSLKAMTTVMVLAAAYPNPSFAADKEVSVKGYGIDPGEATKDALKVAIGQICGEGIASSTTYSSESEKTVSISSNDQPNKTFNNNTNTSAQIASTSSGVVKNYRILEQGVEPSSGRTYVSVSAIISTCVKPNKIKQVSSQEYVSELRKINAEIMKLGNSDALIPNPKSPAQKYNNARILIQRGEVDRALPLYEEIVGGKITFADPIIDLVTILNRLYGPVETKRYIMDKLSTRIPNYAKYYALYINNKKSFFKEDDLGLILEEFEKDPDILSRFPPLAGVISGKTNPTMGMPSSQNDPVTRKRVYDEGFPVNIWKVLINSSDVFLSSVESGDFYAYYIDQTRAEKDANAYNEWAPWSASARLSTECRKPVLYSFDFLGGSCVALGIERDKPHYTH
jgi:hypothetical protein